MSVRTARWRTLCVNQLQLHFKGQMRFAFRHVPLTEIHPHTEIAAESTEFAGAAGLFWEMHDALFENQPTLSIPVVFLIAEELGLPETVLRNALETGQYRNKVRSDFMGRGDAARRRLRLCLSRGGDSGAPRRRYQRVTGLQKRQSIDRSFA